MYRGGSALDREALKRGTSVYQQTARNSHASTAFQRNLFSEPGQDRLTLSCLMDIDKKEI